MELRSITDPEELMAALESAVATGRIATWFPTELSDDGELIEVCIVRNDGHFVHIERADRRS